MDAPAGMYMAFMPNDHVIGYPESFVGSPTVSGFDFIFDALQAKKSVKRVGIEMDAMSAASVQHLQSTYAHIELVDISGVVMQLRLVKSAAEIAVQKEASIITDYVMQQLPTIFKPGRREFDVAADITAALIRGTPELGGYRTDTLRERAAPFGSSFGAGGVP